MPPVRAQSIMNLWQTVIRLVVPISITHITDITVGCRAFGRLTLNGAVGRIGSTSTSGGGFPST